jgi:hypothetical protein
MSKKTGAKKPALRVVGKDGAEDSLFADYGPEEELRPRVGVRRTRRKQESETFARVLHDRAAELYPHRVGGAALQVLIELDRLILAQRNRNPVKLWSPRLHSMGIVKHTRTRALRQLEAAGVIKVEQRGDGLAPLVTHLWYERRDEGDGDI